MFDAFNTFFNHFSLISPINLAIWFIHLFPTNLIMIDKIHIHCLTARCCYSLKIPKYVRAQIPNTSEIIWSLFHTKSRVRSLTILIFNSEIPVFSIAVTHIPSSRDNKVNSQYKTNKICNITDESIEKTRGLFQKNSKFNIF